MLKRTYKDIFFGVKSFDEVIDDDIDRVCLSKTTPNR